MMVRSRFWLVAVALVSNAFGAFAMPPNADPRFCIVPVKGGITAGLGMTGEQWRQTSEAFRLPGIPGPVFRSQFGPAWTVDTERRAVRYSGEITREVLTQDRRISNRPGRVVDHNTFESQIFRRRFVYEKGWFRPSRWRQSSGDGLGDIPGGDIQLPVDQLSPISHVQDLIALGRTLFEGADRFYLFDGSRIRKVRGAQREVIGKFPHVYDLPAIGRVIVVTEAGLYELSREGALIALPTSLPIGGFPGPKFVDWPTAKRALVSTRAGVYVVDQDLRITSVLGGDRVEYNGVGLAYGEVEGPGDAVLVGRDGVFLAVDSEHAGPETCNSARRLHDAIPESDLCLRPMEGTDERSIGFAIGGIIEAPGAGGLLIDTVAGLFLQKPDGSWRNLQPRTGHGTHVLLRAPWADEVLSSTGSVVFPDLSIERHEYYLKFHHVLSGIHAILLHDDNGFNGAGLLRRDGGRHDFRKTGLMGVNGIADAPWLNAAFVSTRNGLFMIDRNGNEYPAKFVNQDDRSVTWSGFDGSVIRERLFGVSSMLSLARFKQIYVSKGNAGWWRITPDMRLLPIASLPVNSVLSYFDPGSGSMLLGTTSGVYAINEEGKADKIDLPQGPSNSVRDIVRAGDAVIAGGIAGLFEIEDLSRIRHVTNGDALHIGAVSRMDEVAFAGLALVKTSEGTFAYEAGTLSRVSDLSSATGTSRPTVLPNLRRVLVSREFTTGPRLFDVARRGADGACSAPLGVAN
jgi:hypothetical protein